MISANFKTVLLYIALKKKKPSTLVGYVTGKEDLMDFILKQFPTAMPQNIITAYIYVRVWESSNGTVLVFE